MKNVRLLAFKMYSYDTESFVSDILAYSRESIILVFDFEKIACYHAPESLNTGFKTRRFIVTRNKLLSKWLTPLRFLANIFCIFSTIFWLIVRFRPQICWMENTYAAFITGILRKLRFTSKTFYLPGDWLAVKKFRNPLAYFGSNILFPLLDRCACRCNDVVLNHSQAIAEARYAFWGRRITNKEALYPYKFKIKVPTATPSIKRKALCFLGSPRKDSGLDLTISALARLSKTHDFALKVIGPKRQDYERFKEFASEQGVGSKVDFMGFVKTDELPSVLADCFCGLNLINNSDSYSSFTIPGKLVHYFQNLLPVIATSGIGYMAQEIQKARIGLIIEPDVDILFNSICSVYEKQDEFRSNIIDYINAQPEVSMYELIEKS